MNRPAVILAVLGVVLLLLGFFKHFVYRALLLPTVPHAALYMVVLGVILVVAGAILWKMAPSTVS